MTIQLFISSFFILLELINCQTDELILNEVYIGGSPTFPQIIEISNPGDHSISLNGWSIENNGSRYNFNPNSLIYAYEYYVITSNEFGSSFTISQFDWLYLFNDNHDLVSKIYVQSFTVATGVVTTNQKSGAYPMKIFTPGAANRYTFSAPLVFSEIFFNSDPIDQYILLECEYTLSSFKDYEIRIKVGDRKQTIPLPSMDEFQGQILIISNLREINDTNYPILYDFWFEPITYIQADLQMPNTKYFGKDAFVNITDGFSIELWCQSELIDLFEYNFTTRTPNVGGYQAIRKTVVGAASQDPINWYIVDAYNWGYLLPCSASSPCPLGDFCVQTQCYGECYYLFWEENRDCRYSDGICLEYTELVEVQGYLTDGSRLTYTYYDFPEFCSWLIKPPRASHINLKFYQFSTQSGVEYLEISDIFENGTSVLVANFTGSLPLEVIENGINSTTGTVLVVWQPGMNSDGTKDGFTASYTAFLDPELISSCSHITLSLSPQKCQCSSGYTLNDDGKNCITSEPKNNMARYFSSTNFCGFEGQISDLELDGVAEIYPNPINGHNIMTCFKDNSSLIQGGISKPSVYGLLDCAYFCSSYNYFSVLSGTCYCGDAYRDPVVECDPQRCSTESYIESCGHFVWSNPLVTVTECSVRLIQSRSYYAYGSYWVRKPIDTTQDFVITFFFKANVAEPHPFFGGDVFGGDGFALVIQDHGTFNLPNERAEGFLGYAGINCIAVEFDYLENPELYDPDVPHISIQTSPYTDTTIGWDSDTQMWEDPNFQASNTSCLKDDGLRHVVRVEYTSSILSVYLDDIPDPVVRAKVNFSDYFYDPTKLTVGLTAGSGGEIKEIDIFRFTFDYICPPGYEVNNDQCDVIRQHENTLPYIIGSVTAIGLVIIIAVITILAVKLKTRISNIKQLPTEVGWSFRSASLDIFHLTWKRTGDNNFYQLVLPPMSPDYNRVKQLFGDCLFGASLTVVNITAVYNDTLVDGFVGECLKWNIRLDDNQKLFQQNSWQDNVELRTWVMEEFQNRVKLFSWNDNAIFPILPACHGTDYSKAEKICNSGFAVLNTADAGFYGKGIYVTSYAEYALRYAIGDRPVIIFAWILPGHPYPVIEHHLGELSLKGGPMKPKCQSHYVRTDSNGYVLSHPDPESYDEIVLAQENFIVPAFLLEIDVKDIFAMQKKLMKEEERNFRDIRSSSAVSNFGGLSDSKKKDTINLDKLLDSNKEDHIINIAKILDLSQKDNNL